MSFRAAGDSNDGSRADRSTYDGTASPGGLSSSAEENDGPGARGNGVTWLDSATQAMNVGKVLVLLGARIARRTAGTSAGNVRDRE